MSERTISTAQTRVMDYIYECMSPYDKRYVKRHQPMNDPREELAPYLATIAEAVKRSEADTASPTPRRAPQQEAIVERISADEAIRRCPDWAYPTAWRAAVAADFECVHSFARGLVCCDLTFSAFSRAIREQHEQDRLGLADPNPLAWKNSKRAYSRAMEKQRAVSRERVRR